MLYGRSAGSWGARRAGSAIPLARPEVRDVTPGQPADRDPHPKQLVHLIMTCAGTTPVFRNRIGLPGSFDEQRKRYPERREALPPHRWGPSPTTAWLAHRALPSWGASA